MRIGICGAHRVGKTPRRPAPATSARRAPVRPRASPPTGARNRRSGAASRSPDSVAPSPATHAGMVGIALPAARRAARRGKERRLHTQLRDQAGADPGDMPTRHTRVSPSTEPSAMRASNSSRPTGPLRCPSLTKYHDDMMPAPSRPHRPWQPAFALAPARPFLRPMLPRLLLAALLGLTFAATACRPRQTPVEAARADQTLLMGNGSEPGDLDPHLPPPTPSSTSSSPSARA